MYFGQLANESNLEYPEDEEADFKIPRILASFSLQLQGFLGPKTSWLSKFLKVVLAIIGSGN